MRQLVWEGFLFKMHFDFNILDEIIHILIEIQHIFIGYS